MSTRKLAFLAQLRPFAVDEAAYGRIYADFVDLLEASEWFVKTMDELEGRKLTLPELEDLLVEVDVKFVDHAFFHLTSLRHDLKAALENFPNEDEE